MGFVSMWGLVFAALLTHYHVTFQQDYSNVGVEMLIECKQAHFVTQILEHVAIMDTDVNIPKPILPKGRCTAIISIMRNDNPIFGDPKDDYVGESAIVTIQH